MYGGDSDRMSKDLKTLKDLNQEANERCIESESDKSHMQEESLNRPWSPDVIAYEVKLVFIRCPEGSTNQAYKSCLHPDHWLRRISLVQFSLMRSEFQKSPKVFSSCRCYVLISYHMHFLILFCH